MRKKLQTFFVAIVSFVSFASLFFWCFQVRQQWRCGALCMIFQMRFFIFILSWIVAFATQAFFFRFICFCAAKILIRGSALFSICLLNSFALPPYISCVKVERFGHSTILHQNWKKKKRSSHEQNCRKKKTQD